jgi:4-hydroxyphenylacetate 3-monooxygenase
LGVRAAIIGSSLCTEANKPMAEHPESILEGKKRPFTGAEFLESLRDGREVYIYGERVKDVTTHPAFRNAAASAAKLYDALHDRKTKDVLTAPTDTGSGGYTHRFFKAARSREDVMAQRDAIAAWARITYGWMGRSPDYKAAFLNTLGANAEFYGKFAGNARAWHKRGQEAVLYLNHALINPPIDRNKPVEQVKDVYITIQKETDAGIYVSGAKVVATNSALTHYNFLGQNMGQEITDPSMVVMFIAPMNTPGVKLVCRGSYELAAAATGSPWDYPLSSRFDENDAIFIFDNAFIPWENVLVHRDVERLKAFYPRSGFVNGFTLQGATRLAVKLDFISGLLYKAARATGTEAFRGVQAQIGEVIGWRNLFWSLSDAMACNPQPWVDGAVLPNIRASTAYRLFMTEAYPAVRQIVERVIASGLIYLPSHARDFKNPDIDKYLARYVRGSNGIDYRERIKVMKMLWDAVGSEFGARHELYEMNYAGSHELVRLFPLQMAQASGALNEMVAFAEQCMADYDEDGWNDPDYRGNEDVSIVGKLGELG